MERIIIGTGRCGSTLLSNLMSLHPEVMVLSEFFRGLDPAQGWPSDRDDVSPDEFIEILSREDGVSPIYMAHGDTISETLIDVEKEKSGRRGYISKPIISFIALRFLSEDPDALFDELVEQVKTYPPQTLHAHFERLIRWLLEKFGKPVWIEAIWTFDKYLPSHSRSVSRW